MNAYFKEIADLCGIRVLMRHPLYIFDYLSAYKLFDLQQKLTHT